MVARFLVGMLIQFSMLLIAVNAFGQTSHEVALRTVAGEPNGYLTVNGPCGPHVILGARAGEDENEVSGRQIFTILDLNGGKLEWGDKVRIKICSNYLRTNSEQGLDSSAPLNSDGTPDSRTVFTIVKPPDNVNAKPDTFILLQDETGQYVTAPGGANNGIGEALSARSDYSGNPRNILKVIANPNPPAILTGTGSYNGPGGFDRGMQSTMYCGNNPESWVRGSAKLDRKTGRLSMTIQLETDSTVAGPKGKVIVMARDATGNSLATADSGEIGIGGKPPGKARIQDFGASASIPLASAKNVRSLSVESQCTGHVTKLWGIINPADAMNAFKILISK